MIEMFLESTLLEEFTMVILDFESADLTAFRRIILACSRIEELTVEHMSLSQSLCDSVASLLRDPTSILSKIYLFGPINKEGLSTIAAGLVNNTTLKNLNFAHNSNSSPIDQVLCDTSSIERIIASNHTLESTDCKNMPPHLKDYLRLNKETDKELVIRTKIARYYFQGEFNVSTFASMDMKCLLRVLAMIGGGETNRNAAIFRKGHAVHQQSAIFRLLKCLPDLCNVSSRDACQIDGNGARDDSKRQKVNK